MRMKCNELNTNAGGKNNRLVTLYFSHEYFLDIKQNLIKDLNIL